MPVEYKFENNNLLVLHVSGKLGKVEHDQMQAQLGSDIQRLGEIKVLAILKAFAGWEAAEGWEDTSFSDRNDPYIKKLAIVGEGKWRDLVTLFTLKGLRPVPIEYFTEDQEDAARQWLESP